MPLGKLQGLEVCVDFFSLTYIVIFPGRYHSQYCHVPGHLLCVSLTNCGYFGDQQKGNILCGFGNLTCQAHPGVCFCLLKILFYLLISLFIIQVFGNGITDVLLSQGVMVVSYSNKLIKLYSFEHIVQKVDSMFLFRCVHFAEYLWNLPYHLQLLWLLHISDFFFFFQYMTEKVTLGKPSPLLSGKAVGDFPFGIPVNIKITGEYVLFSHNSITTCRFSL